MGTENEVELFECSGMDDVGRVAEMKALALGSKLCRPLGECRK